MYHAIEAMKFSMHQDQMITESISHNIANLNTPGYKRQVIENRTFQSAIMKQLFAQGTLKETSNPLHLALTDTGFFQVQNENGIFYTRRGDFMINAKGEICTKNGDLLSGHHESILVGDHAFTVNRKGEVLIDNQKMDHIQIVEFQNPSQLQYMGDGLYQSIDNPQPSNTHILQGYLEESNVKTMDEMAHLMRTSRHFELSQRILKTADSMTATAITHLGEIHV